MKIGISCYPTFGGSGVLASELGMGLAERGHEVHFITYAVPGRLDLRRPGIYYHEVSVPDYPLFEYPAYPLALASKMAEVADRQGLHIIHAHYAIPHAASAIMARSMLGGRPKVITTLHGTDITLVGRDPSFLPVVKYSMERSDAVTAVSVFLREEICRAFTCEIDCRVVYNFIDPRDYKRFVTEPFRSRFAPDGKKLLVHVSNFRPVKRVQDVVATFLKVREKVPTRLILIGAGPELPKAELMVREAGAEDDLVIFGNTENVPEIVAACDLMLLPSESESFGLAALEAMACSVPVIATDTGGIPEVIDSWQNGVLAPIGDTDVMASAAIKLLSDDALRKKLGAAARKTAFERFPISSALDQYEEIYREVIGIK